jgi:hypothetical protein
VNRRPTQAAGRSWRKWEDPVVYRRPWLPDLAFWALCIAVGALVGLEAR